MRSNRLIGYLAAAITIGGTWNARAQTPPADVPKVGDVRMHGYFRTGYGISSQKGRMVCFQVPGAPTKYRLGNECDQYGEFLFSAPAYVGEDGVVGTANVQIAAYAPFSVGFGNQNSQNFTAAAGGPGTGVGFGFSQMWFDFTNIGWLNGGVPWIGRRYYKRVDAHITDFFYWNPSGLGGGIENVDIAGMKLSYAAFVVDGPSVGVMGQPMVPVLPVQNVIGIRNDVQLRGIPIYPDGELRVGLSAIVNHSASSSNTHHGFSGVLQHVHKVLGGANELAVQYGIGPGTGLGGVDALTNSSDVTRLRILDTFHFQPLPWLGGQLLFVYQRDQFVAGSQNWLSAGGRLAFAIAEHAKLLVEVGHDNVKPSDMSARSLTKFTIAPAIVAAKAFWSRPELRVFYTFATWNAASREAGIDSGDIFKATTKTNGSSFGIHAESWW